MANTPVSLALERVTEQLEALNFATDAITALRNNGDIDSDFARLRLRRLSRRRTDLRDQRMTIMLTQAVASPPTEAEISALRAKVKALHELNVSAAALNDLIAAALEIAAS